MVHVFKNVGEKSTAKNCHQISLLSAISKVFKKLVNNRIADHLEKYGLFSEFQYGFRFSQSTADLLTIVSDRIARAFNNRSGVTQDVALDISQAFGMLLFFANSNILLHKLKNYLVLFLLFSVMDSFEWFWMESLHKNI